MGDRADTRSAPSHARQGINPQGFVMPPCKRPVPVPPRGSRCRRQWDGIGTKGQGLQALNLSDSNSPGRSLGCSVPLAETPPSLVRLSVTSLEISIHFILHISPEKSLKATFSQSRWDSVVLNLLPSLEGRLFFMHSSRVSMSS